MSEKAGFRAEYSDDKDNWRGTHSKTGFWDLPVIEREDRKKGGIKRPIACIA